MQALEIRPLILCSIPPCAPLVPSPLEAFSSMLFILIGFQFVIQRGCITVRGVESAFEEICVSLKQPMPLYIVFSHMVVFSPTLISIMYFVGRSSHPSHVFIINIFFV